MTPRTVLSDGQRKALAELIRSIRRPQAGHPHPWDMPGIVAAIAAAEAIATGPADVIAAAATAAALREYRTPAMISRPGRHWPTREDGTTSRPPSYDVRCPEHPDHAMPCPTCRTLSEQADHAAGIAAVRAALTREDS